MVSSLLVTNASNALVTTKTEPIMQRSKHAHLVKIYVADTYLDVFSTKEATVSLEVLAPNGKRETKILEAEDNSGKEGYLVYYYYLESAMTTGAGDIEFGMNIVYTNTDDGSQVVRTIDTCKLTISPIDEWVVTATDESLTSLQNALTNMNTIATAIVNGNAGTSTVSDIAITRDADGNANLHLVNAGGVKIGAGISASDDSDDASDGTIDGFVDLDTLLATAGGTP